MKKSSKMKIATIVCWCVVAVAMAGLAVWLLTGTLFGLPTGFKLTGFSIGGIENLVGKYELRGTETTPVTGVNSLIIDWVAGDVTVTPYGGAEIEFREYAQRDLSDRERMCITVSNGTVSVRYIEEANVLRMPPKRLEVLIPRELSERFKRLTADSATDNISVTGIKADKLAVGSASGNIELTDVRAGELYADSTSGEITLTRAGCGSITLGSTSGNLKTTDTSAGALSASTISGNQKLCGEFNVLDLDSTSGDITVENSETAAELSIDSISGTQTATGAFSVAKCSSTSGDVRVTSTVVPDKLNIDTISGNVTLTMPNSGGITLNHSTISGSLKSDIPLTLRGGSSFVISTVSGDARILELE